MLGLPWRHTQLPATSLKQLEASLPADLRLTEAQVQAAMTYAAAKIESDGSVSQHESARDDVQPADNSAAKSSVLDLQERDAEAGQQGKDFRPWETEGSVCSQTNSSSHTKLNDFKKRNHALEAKITTEKEHLKETSEKIRSLIMTEMINGSLIMTFPQFFRSLRNCRPHVGKNM